ncbi:DurN family substrate-assisted peptide maturase [Actinomadura macra]|uniref:DurN family substrate-assisted peptide maturase n=1 Tax=Actinomadura macra TaxID=46164 RepID=UPI00082DE788|nr:DurN family substrate-assisted peptide maturase [Actinomadura macra]
MRTGPKPLSDLTKHKGIETVRQIQSLMILCSILPPDGKMREMLKLALDIRNEEFPADIGPIRDLHPQATKTWLEHYWTRTDISAKERELIDWQTDKQKMDIAVEELQKAEQQLGIRLAPQTVD